MIRDLRAAIAFWQLFEADWAEDERRRAFWGMVRELNHQGVLAEPCRNSPDLRVLQGDPALDLTA